ncbi:MAG TPA: hypothetical protein VF785_05040 [Gemmatimonadaceae bacterium]
MSASAANPARARSAGTAIVVVAAFALVVRILAGMNELWLDEIWSYVLAHRLTSAVGVFTAIHHDNNHYLNTLYLYVIGATPVWLVYRIPAIVAGVASVLLAALIAKRASIFTGLFAAVLFASSFLMILYSSEARGYGLAVCFALLAVFAADRFTVNHRTAWGTSVAVASMLGFLAHLTFVQAYVAIVVWTGYRLFRQRRGWRAWIDDMVLCHLPPAALVAWLYLVDIRRMEIGGGPESSGFDVMTRALSLTLGGPAEGVASVLLAVAALVLLTIAIVLVWRSGSDLWLLFATATLISPALMLVVARPAFLFERYFLVAIAFAVLSMAWPLAALLARNRAAAFALVTLFVAANSVHTARLITRGRGHYLEAMRWMSQHSERRGGGVAIGSDHDFRNGMVVGFYSQFLPPSPRIVHLQQGEWPADGPEWLLLHSQDRDFRPAPRLGDRGGHQYLLANVYPYAELSGWTWAVYHNTLDKAP